MILMIDNYDSFTYNLVQYLAELGADVLVYRNDEITVNEVVTIQPRAIVLSPGPGRPDKAGIVNALITKVAWRSPVSSGIDHDHIRQSNPWQFSQTAGVIRFVGKVSERSTFQCDLPDSFNVPVHQRPLDGSTLLPFAISSLSHSTARSNSA
jgi:hypothetical protein